MNPSRQFILRPVATSLLMVAILLAGIIAYRVLPLSALPEVDYPTIQIVTLYPGASPDVVTSSITAPLERQFGQIPGLIHMSSTSSGGASVITLQFSLALGQVQNLGDTRVAQKISQLPGVGLVALSGGQRPAVRVRVNPKAAAAYNLGLEELRTAVSNANVNQAKGSFDGPTRASTIDANDQLRSADDYRNLVVAYRNNSPVRLSDVADVIAGA